MHPNPVFRAEERARNVAFARDRAFGSLCLCGPEGPLMVHVPFLLDADARGAEVHLMRSNPVARALDMPRAALLAVTGPDGYVSPDWYGIPDQVPTWNYVAVHLRGTLERLEGEALRGVLDRLSDAMERRLPKVPWHSGKMSPGVMERMMRALVPCRMDVAEIDGTWKLSQNKPEGARAGAIAGIAEGAAPGQEIDALAALMRDAMLDPGGRAP
jgi:transcriptional regulator